MSYRLDGPTIDAMELKEARRFLKVVTAMLAVMLDRQRGENGVSRGVLKGARGRTVEIIPLEDGAVTFRLVGESNPLHPAPPLL